MDVIEPYGHKKAHNSLELWAFVVFSGSLKTLGWWRRGDLNIYYMLLNTLIIKFNCTIYTDKGTDNRFRHSGS